MRDDAHMIAPDAGAAVLDRQRRAFLRDGAPSRQVRKDRLRRLRAAVLAHRAEISAAVSADFGHRSRHETELMELVPAIQAIDYLIRHLRRFMKPERRPMGAYHGIEGFRSMSHAKGVFVQGRWNAASLVRAPFGRLADRVLNVMLRR